MFRKILIILGWILFVAFVGGSITYCWLEMKDVKCQAVSVHIDPSSPRFIDEADLAQVIEKENNGLIGKRMGSLNLYKLENNLKKLTTIKDVEVFKRINSKSLRFAGRLVVNVSERTPIMRVKTDSDDYYVDAEGVKIPVSTKYAANVMVVNGAVTDELIKEKLIPLVLYIDKTEFWKAQVEQIYVKGNGELIMVPQVGDHIIEFGSADDYKRKFRNLKEVYLKGFNHSGWDQYKIVSVKYYNQVVCTKR